MKDPNIKVKVVHSQSKPAWNIVGTTLGCKYKIAQVPYLPSDDIRLHEMNMVEAHEHASFISDCFNKSKEIIKLI